MRELMWIEVEDGKWKADDAPYVWNMLRIRADEYRFYCDAQFRGFGASFTDAAQKADAMRMFPSAFRRAMGVDAQEPSFDEQTEIMADVMMLSPQPPQPAIPLFILAGQTIFQISGANGAPALQWESYPNEPTLAMRKGDSLDRGTAIQRTRHEFEEEQWRLRGRSATGP